MNFRDTKKGFTLIELLVVISIIGLLSSVVLASVGTARSRGKVAAGKKFDTYNYRGFGADGLYWNMNAINGSNQVIESTGNNLTLTPVSSPYPVVTTGVQGNAISFAGPGNGYFIFNVPASNPLYNINRNGGTLTMWIKASVYSQNAILTGHIDLGGDRLYVQYTGGTVLVTRGNPAVSVTLATGVPVGEWINVGLSWVGGTSAGGAVTMKGYLNGAGILPQPLYSPGVSPNDFSGLTIGAQNSGNVFNGSIDEVHIYPNVLADSEIRERYLAEAEAHGIDIAKK